MEIYFVYSFFPQIVQGPIARFDCWKNNLNKIYKFEYKEYTFGWQLIVWGYFLKFVVADKAGIMVNTVYENLVELPGIYILTAAILYSIQLYADFCGCVNIAIGTAQTFGIVLQPNFRQPYFAESIRDFWRRWHLTLSNWLRDYVYIPLGGNQKGKVRQCINILVVFVVSGIWHGFGLNFVLWGILHGIYQVFEIIFDRIGLPVNRKQGNRCSQIIKISISFALVTFGWMLFRAQSVEQFFNLVRLMFSVWNPEAILDGDAYYRMGLSRLQTFPLILGIAGLFVVDLLHERGISIRKKVSEYPIVLRWMIYLAIIMFILISAATVILKPKRLEMPYDNTRKERGFYVEPRNELDIVFVGSSQLFSTIMPSVSEEEQEIKSYVFAGNEQTFGISYYYIMEALKYQNPKAIVLETTFCNWGEPPRESVVRINFDDMRWGKAKILGILNNVEPNEWEYYFFELAKYHSRWDALCKEDFNIKECYYDENKTKGGHLTQKVMIRTKCMERQ